MNTEGILRQRKPSTATANPSILTSIDANECVYSYAWYTVCNESIGTKHLKCEKVLGRV